MCVSSCGVLLKVNEKDGSSGFGVLCSRKPTHAVMLFYSPSDIPCNARVKVFILALNDMDVVAHLIIITKFQYLTALRFLGYIFLTSLFALK